MLDALKRHYADNFDEQLSEFRAEQLLDFVVAELGPAVSTRACRMPAASSRTGSTISRVRYTSRSVRSARRAFGGGGAFRLAPFHILEALDGPSAPDSSAIWSSYNTHYVNLDFAQHIANTALGHCAMRIPRRQGYFIGKSIGDPARLSSARICESRPAGAGPPLWRCTAPDGEIPAPKSRRAPFVAPARSSKPAGLRLVSHEAETSAKLRNSRSPPISSQSQHPGAQHGLSAGASGLVALTKALMKRPSICGVTASASKPAPSRKIRASSAW